MSTASTARTTITTTLRLAGLCLTSLTLAGCDQGDAPTDDGVAQATETEGAIETAGDPTACVSRQVRRRAPAPRAAAG